MNRASDPRSNPYAPPAAPMVPAGSPSTQSYESERRSVALVLLLCVVTLNIYPAVWYLRRARFLDGLSADKKIGKLPWVYVAALVVDFGVALAGAPAEATRAVELGAGIVSLMMAFRVAHILRSDFARTGRFIRISGVAVFFFGCLYLQHSINKAADMPARAGAQA